MEFRRHPRVKAQLEISFVGETVAGQGILCDISLGGCGVRSNQTVPVGAFLQATIHLPKKGELLKVDVAVVRWSAGNAFGLDFLQVGQEEQDRLKRLIKSL